MHRFAALSYVSQYVAMIQCYVGIYEHLAGMPADRIVTVGTWSGLVKPECYLLTALRGWSMLWANDDGIIIASSSLYFFFSTFFFLILVTFLSYFLIRQMTSTSVRQYVVAETSLHEITLKIRYWTLFLKLKGTAGNEGSIRIQKLYFKHLHITLVAAMLTVESYGPACRCCVSGEQQKTWEHNKVVLGYHEHNYLLVFLPDQITGQHVSTEMTRYWSKKMSSNLIWRK